MSDDGTQLAYAAGKREGYRLGEYERVALATANSDLRSQVRELQEQLKAGS